MHRAFSSHGHHRCQRRAAHAPPLPAPDARNAGWSRRFAPHHGHGQRQSAHAPRLPAPNAHDAVPVFSDAEMAADATALAPFSMQKSVYTRSAPLATNAARCFSGSTVGLPPDPCVHARARGVPSATLRHLACHLRFHRNSRPSRHRPLSLALGYLLAGNDALLTLSTFPSCSCF